MIEPETWPEASTLQCIIYQRLEPIGLQLSGESVVVVARCCTIRAFDTVLIHIRSGLVLNRGRSLIGLYKRVSRRSFPFFLFHTIENLIKQSENSPSITYEANFDSQEHDLFFLD
jgi:hypothetical protein